MPRHRIIFTLLIIPLFLIAQDIDEAIRLFNAFQFDRARLIFEKIIEDENNPRIAEAHYYLGKLSLNPDSALRYYSKVIKDYPQSRYADISYLEVAKFHITHENYEDAVITLQELIKNYPDTNLKEEFLFWSGISYIAIGQNEPGIKFLKNLITSFPKSVWSDRARNIITNQEVNLTKEYYTIQVGSYRNEGNALKYVDELKKQGLDARVVEAEVKGITYYRVWVGQFVTLQEAKTFSVKLDSLGIKGNVVKGH